MARAALVATLRPLTGEDPASSVPRSPPRRRSQAARRRALRLRTPHRAPRLRPPRPGHRRPAAGSPSSTPPPPLSAGLAYRSSGRSERAAARSCSHQALPRQRRDDTRHRPRLHLVTCHRLAAARAGGHRGTAGRRAAASVNAWCRGPYQGAARHHGDERAGQPDLRDRRRGERRVHGPRSLCPHHPGRRLLAGIGRGTGRRSPHWPRRPRGTPGLLVVSTLTARWAKSST